MAIAIQLVAFVFVQSSHAVEDTDQTAAPSARRVPWTTSRITGSPDPPRPYRVERAHEHLKFHQPVDMTAPPGDERMFVAELEGRIYSFRPDRDPNTAELCFDLREGIAGAEQLYGLTFHPRFQENRYCYLCYVLESGLPDGTRVSRFTVSATDPPRIDPQSERRIITWLSGGHNGGCLKFGPDGCLYISTGDGTGPFPPDVLNTGQDVTDLLSSILRIDVDREDPGRAYRIPRDNPLVDQSGARGEIWSYGFRNPWKMSFDPATGDLWVGDVGWELWELIFRVQRGGNYGWSIVEGRQPVQPAGLRGPTPIRPPTVDHPHTEARSITGGYVYHGRQLPELAGAYIYGDYETGKIWGLRYGRDEVTWQQELADTPLKIITFAVDQAGELYVVDYAGTIHRLVPNTADENRSKFPRLLSETGLFDSVADYTPAPGVVPYDINVPMWADGATASRLLAIPGDGQVAVSDGSQYFPPGSVLAKTISIGVQATAGAPRRMETQVLHFEYDQWRAYTYAWNDAQTDAELVAADGELRTFQWKDASAPDGARQQTWRFASRAQCLLCHNVFAGTVLAFDHLQLSALREPSNDSHSKSASLWHAGVLKCETVDPRNTMPRLDDTQANIAARVRAYLHANCAHCHRNGGGGTATVELDYERPLANTGILSKPPTQGNFGIDDARIIAPGNPYRSVMYYRMATLGRGRMPHLGSERIDRAGMALIRDWIAQLKADESLESDADLELLRGASSPDPETSNAAAAVHRLLASTSGALALSDAMGAGEIPDSWQQRIVQQATAAGRPEVHGLFERFLPESERSQRLAGAVDAAQVLALVGDPAAGERLFQDESVSCIKCHRVGSRGADVGPDLSHIGRERDKSQLLESLLEPSKKIDPKYIAYVIETTSGTVHTGLLAGRTGGAIELRDNQGKTIRLSAADVERIAPVATSLMPELLLRDLTVQQAADLLEYLGSLK